MPQPPCRSCLWSRLFALLLLVLAPAALDTGRHSASAEPAGTAVANALGPSHESALVVEAVGPVGVASALRDGGRSRIPPGSLLLLPGALALLLGLRPAARRAPASSFPALLRPLPSPAPRGPRAPPVPRLS
jgi:hypothetical protein